MMLNHLTTSRVRRLKENPTFQPLQQKSLFCRLLAWGYPGHDNASCDADLPDINLRKSHSKDQLSKATATSATGTIST